MNFKEQFEKLDKKKKLMLAGAALFLFVLAYAAIKGGSENGNQEVGQGLVLPVDSVRVAEDTETPLQRAKRVAEERRRKAGYEGKEQEQFEVIQKDWEQTFANKAKAAKKTAATGEAPNMALPDTVGDWRKSAGPGWTEDLAATPREEEGNPERKGLSTVARKITRRTSAVAAVPQVDEFGIVVVGKSKAAATTESVEETATVATARKSKAATTKGMVKAVINGTQAVESGGRVSLRLTQDVVLPEQGLSLPKGTLLSGRVSISDRLSIAITSARIEGENVAVDWFVCDAQDTQEGIAYTQQDSRGKQLAAGVAANAARQALYNIPYLGYAAASMVGGMGTGSGRMKMHLTDGYKVLINTSDN